MSIKFVTDSDTFLHAPITGKIAARSPITIAGWIMFDNLINAKTIFAAGFHTSQGSHQARTMWTKKAQYQTLSDGAGVVAETIDNTLTNGIWYYIAIRRSAENNGSIYVGTKGSAATIVENTSDFVGSWTNPTDLAFALGGPDVGLSGGQSATSSFKAAEMAIWDRDLPDSELDAIKEGASPSANITNLLAHWIIDGGSTAASLVDQINVNANGDRDLVMRMVSDASEAVGVNPPAYNIEHPGVSATTSLYANLVQDNLNTPFANKTGLHYSVSEGAGVGAMTKIYSGTDGTTDANGVFSIATPASSIGDDLILVVFDPVAADIYADDTLVMVGSVVVR